MPQQVDLSVSSMVGLDNGMPLVRLVSHAKGFELVMSVEQSRALALSLIDASVGAEFDKAALDTITEDLDLPVSAAADFVGKCRERVTELRA